MPEVISNGFGKLKLSRFRDPMWKAFLIPGSEICVFSHACFQVVFLMMLMSESRRLGFRKQAFGVRGVAKIT